MLDATAEAEAIRRIDAAKKDGDTLGGEIEVVVRGLSRSDSGVTRTGIGSSTAGSPDSLMSIPAVKGVEIGLGFEAARRPGSEVHDPIDRRRPCAMRGADSAA